MKTYFPPKPLLISIDQPLFSELEKRTDVICEPKYNGTRLILKRFEDGDCEFWNRYGEKIKNFKPSQKLTNQLSFINCDCVLDGELLHFKTKGIKNCIIIFDVYLWNGESTLDLSFKERRKLLESNWIGYDSIVFPWSDFLGLAPQFYNDFTKWYNEVIVDGAIEGLVLKSLSAKVTLGRKESPTVSYMFKVRKPSSTYRF